MNATHESTGKLRKLKYALLKNAMTSEAAASIIFSKFQAASF
jgi:hypothetical protein